VPNLATWYCLGVETLGKQQDNLDDRSENHMEMIRVLLLIASRQYHIYFIPQRVLEPLDSDPSRSR
jgi:hypothetical protein